VSSQIDKTAFIHSSAKIGRDVSIGRNCFVGPEVVIKDKVSLMPGAYIDSCTIIEESCIIYPFASLGCACQDLKYKGEKSFVRIGAGTTIRECVTVNRATGEGEYTTVGSGCLIMAYSHVAHNCVVGDKVIIANSGALAGHVTIGDHAVIGGIVAIHQFTRIGDYAIIGGCSKVVQDIPPFMMADGHPAVVHGLNAVGLTRHGFSGEARSNLKKAYKILFRSGLSTTHALESISRDLPGSPEVSRLVDFIRTSQRGISK
jgi:UDP-N-acetylglucosamine acyltransferase